jgi:cobalt-zinc-cadmium efflux system outer membrane protein
LSGRGTWGYFSRFRAPGGRHAVNDGTEGPPDGGMRCLLAVLALLCACSCATVDSEPQWQALQEITAQRSVEPLVWARSTSDRQAVQDAVHTLLSDGLTRAEAMRVAVLQSPTLQSEFEELGIAAADLLQAGLLTNPSLDVFLIFPTNLADSSIALALWLSDAWIIPARKQVYNARSEVTVRRVAAAVVDTAAAAAEAYDEVTYRTAAAALEREVLAVRRQAAQQTQQQARSATLELDRVRAESEVYDQEIAVARADLELTRARANLDRVLALSSDDTNYLVASVLEMPPAASWTEEAAIPFALEHRLDVAWARVEVEQREHEVALERARIVEGVSIGPAYEGAFGRFDGAGPTLGVELPIFDQHQAPIAKAMHRLRQAQLHLAARELQARFEVKSVLADLAFRRQQVETINAHLEPLRQRAVEYTDRPAPSARLTYLDVLHARAQEIAMRREHLQALRDLRRGEVRLQQVLWGRGMQN